MTDTDWTDAATNSKMTGHIVGQRRTANKRHNRAIAALQAAKSAKIVPVANTKPAKAAA